jgi:hypothetical protein
MEILRLSQSVKQLRKCFLNLENSILVISMMMEFQEKSESLQLLKMAQSMKENGTLKRMLEMEEESRFGMMDQDMKVTGLLTRQMEEDD